MRITKVKVDNKMVLMHRTNAKGILVLGDTSKDDKTKIILPDKKRDSFQLSIKNKTVAKNVRAPLCEQCSKRFKTRTNGDKFTKCKKCQEHEDRLDNIRGQINKIVEKLVKVKYINNQTELPDLEECELDDISLCLGHKFKESVNYKDNNNNICSFDLADIIHKYSKANDANLFKPYIMWKEWYIKSKSDNIIKSIENNVIDTGSNTSLRKRALKGWEIGNLKLDSLENIYKTDELGRKLNEKKRSEFKNDFEFRRALKQTLQEHQKTIFGKNNGVKPEEIEANKKLKLNRKNEKLCVYHLEIVKYLEHYFPIKRTKRKNIAEDIAYYLDLKTIKSTVQSQIENAIRANLLQQGKVVHHDLNQDTTSDTLSRIKRREAFVLNLIGACAFAANNIRNIVDKNQLQDILGKKEFKASLDNRTVDDKLFKFFYGNINPDTTDNYLWGMRGSVQQIRNNIFHYKSDSIDKVFVIRGFETNQPTGEKYSNSIFKGILDNEIKNIPIVIAEQLKSGGILSYYNLNDIKECLNKCEFSLCRSSLPFTPGFKKVANGGRGYQYSSGDRNDKKYDLKLKYYINKNADKNEEEKYQAHYFFLKLLYNNMFIPYFTDEKNISAFKDAVNFVRDVNNKFAKNNPNKFAFKDVRKMEGDDTISSYMSYVQSQFIQEQNKKGTEDSSKRINFENFLLQVFIKGFDSYLRYKNVDLTPELQFEVGITDKDKANKLNSFEKNIVDEYKSKIFTKHIGLNDDSHIAFFTFCKLLNASHLSNLRNELIKFRQTGNFNLHHIIEIIELCLLSADKSPVVWNELYKNKNEWETHIKKFVEKGADIDNWGNLFSHEDNCTPIMHANISLCVKYGTEDLLEHIVSGHKLEKTDYDKWKKGGEYIATYTKERDELHKQWVEAKRNDEKEKDKKKRFNVRNFIKSNHETYKSLCKKIDEYNWLDNKIHFVHLNKLHNLIIDILGRMVGFVSLWDRDFQLLDAHRTSDQFRLKGVVSFQTISDELDKQTNIDEITNHEITKKDGSEINESDRDSLKSCLESKRGEYRKVFFKAGTKPFESRNNIAHFTYLYKDPQKFSLIKPINDLRDLFNYDRKLKNAVTKAIIDLFDKNGMELTLKFDNNTHKIELDDIKPKTIDHLGKSVSTNHVHQDFCEICKKLFEK